MASVQKPKEKLKEQPAKPRELTPQEKDRLALDHAVALARQFVSAIVKSV